MRIYTQQDVTNENDFSQTTVAIIGYGAQGRAQALCLRDSGINLVVGVRTDGSSYKQAQADGFSPLSISEAVEIGKIIHLLIPDECQPQVYEQIIAPRLNSEKALSFAHGFNIVYQYIKPPPEIDVFLVAPKGPGPKLRKLYLENSGLMGLIAVAQNPTGRALKNALNLAHALGLTRTGVLESTFSEETYSDLFSEQAVICGGLSELIKAGFETLVHSGISPQMAYLECLYEVKLIADLLVEGGMHHMWNVISNTAEFGGRLAGPQIINQESRQAMQAILKKIHNGDFARQFMADYSTNFAQLNSLRLDDEKNSLEPLGAQLRALYQSRISNAKRSS